MRDIVSTNGRQFINRVSKLARQHSIPVSFDKTKGKGSHGTLCYGARHAVMPDRKKELKPGTFRGVCKQLGIDPDDL